MASKNYMNHKCWINLRNRKYWFTLIESLPKLAIQTVQYSTLHRKHWSTVQISKRLCDCTMIISHKNLASRTSELKTWDLILTSGNLKCLSFKMRGSSLEFRGLSVNLLLSGTVIMPPKIIFPRLSDMAFFVPKKVLLVCMSVWFHNLFFFFQHAAIILQEGQNNDQFVTHPSRKTMLWYRRAHSTCFYLVDMVVSLLLLCLALTERPGNKDVPANDILFLPVPVSIVKGAVSQNSVKLGHYKTLVKLREM